MADLLFKAPIHTSSGLGQASRDLIQVLEHSGILYGLQHIDIGGSPLPENERCPLPHIPDYDTVLILCLPFQIERYVEADKRNIGYLFWETSDLPESVIPQLQKLDTILTTTPEFVEVFSRYHPDVRLVPQVLPPLPQLYEKQNVFHVYSIFELTERKSPLELIQAYWLAFQNVYDVQMTIKVRQSNHAQLVLAQNRLMEKMKLPHYPGLTVVGRDFSGSELERFHGERSCFLSLSRGEGWCMPLVDALLAGNHVVSTETGCFDQVRDLPGVFPVASHPEPVVHDYQLYSALQTWKRPDVLDAARQLRAAYEAWKQRGSPEDRRAELVNRFGVDAVSRLLTKTV